MEDVRKGLPDGSQGPFVNDDFGDVTVVSAALTGAGFSLAQLYEVAKHFYEKFIPQLEKVAGEEVAKELLDKHVYTQEGHKWHRDGMSVEALEKIRKFYEKRYEQ